MSWGEEFARSARLSEQARRRGEGFGNGIAIKTYTYPQGRWKLADLLTWDLKGYQGHTPLPVLFIGYGRSGTTCFVLAEDREQRRKYNVHRVRPSALIPRSDVAPVDRLSDVLVSRDREVLYKATGYKLNVSVAVVKLA
jgi:hypothetical protein